MTYFEYLMKTREEDGPEVYTKYLVEVCGYSEGYAKGMADLQYQNPENVLPG